MTIKFAKVEDIPQIVSFCYKTYQGLENLDLPKPDFIKITMKVTNWILNDVVLVHRESEDSKEINGVVVAERGSFWWSNDNNTLKTALFFVNPEYENSGRIAFDLVDALKEYADDFELNVLLDIIDKEENIDKLKKFIGMKNFTPFSISGIYKQ
jgi:hypothetical protein